MSELTYDSAALLAAERGDRRMWALHRRALERGGSPTVPAGVLVEVWRAAARTAPLLAGCHVEPLVDTTARAAGLLLGRCQLDVEAVDAVVVESALRRRSAVVTGNRVHLEALAAGAGRRRDVLDA